MATADLIIRVITDTSKAKGLDETAGKFGKVGKGLAKMAAPAALALGGIVAFGAGAVSAASDVQQSLGAVDAVFGTNAKQIKAWADQSATAVGLSKNAYMELATVTGAQLKNMGLPMDQVTGKTNDLINMGADLAAQFGGTTKDAVEAIGSAMRGETDPIERYGISIKQADIAAQQAAEGTSKLTGAAGKQAKTMALLHLMNKQSADSTGAFAREQDSAAHQAQVASAQYQDMQAALGVALLPAVTKVAAALGKMALWVNKNRVLAQVIIGIIATLATTVLVLVAAMKVYNLVMEITAVVSKAAWLSSLGPILLVIAAVALIVVAIVILWKKCSAFRNAVKAIWAAIKVAINAVGVALRKVGQIAATVFGWIKSHWRLLAMILGGPFVAAALLIIANFGRIKAVISSVLSWIKSAWHAAWGSLRAVTSAALGGIRSVVSDLTTWVRHTWGTMVDAIKGAMSGLGAILAAPFNLVKAAIQGAINLVNSLISALGRIKVPHISLPHIPGTRSVTGLAGDAPMVAGRSAAPAVPSARASSGSRAGWGTTINVYGAIDPEATARQIARIQSGHSRRIGLRVT